MKKTPSDSTSAPQPPLFAMDLDETQRISLKTLSSQCSQAQVPAAPLISTLSTLYANAMVAQGFLASLQGRVLNTPLLLDRNTMLEQTNLALESVRAIALISSECSDILESAKSAPSSS